MKFKILILTIFILLFSFGISISQNNIDSLFLNLKIDSCSDVIIKSLSKKTILKRVEYKYTLRTTFVLKDSKFDTYNSDSLIVLISKEFTGFSQKFGVIKFQEIEIERYYTDVKVIHKAYNDILVKLLDSKYDDFGTVVGYSSKDGAIISENESIIDTGLFFSYNQNIQKVYLCIDYNLKNSYILSIRYVREKVNCN